MNELIKCPFCSSESVKVERLDNYHWGACLCSGCGAAGPEVHTGYDGWKNLALSKWNMRDDESLNDKSI